MSYRVLFIGGSLNQTTQMHQIAQHLMGECECYFTPYYADGFIDWLARRGWLDFTILGGRFRRATLEYLHQHRLPIDERGQLHPYDLVVTCQDLLVPRNIRGRKIVLVQEGMTDPEGLLFYGVKYLELPRWIASTAATGLSDAYTVFCVASEGYRQLFLRKGVRAEKLRVTGIPNFDNCEQYRHNDFPYHGYVLVATSDSRETLRYENRAAFLQYAARVAKGRPILVKLHPNERVERAAREVYHWLPGAVVFSSGNTNHMIANCEVLIARYSSVVYVGLALGKEVHSAFNLELLRQLLPWQNGGRSAEYIAEVCWDLLRERPVRTFFPPPSTPPQLPRRQFHPRKRVMYT